ncbi:MAG: IS200/IS605 family transposase [Chitinophagales bacterium]
MPHSYNKIWIHAIYATKEREPLIRIEIEQIIYGHMKEQLVEISCPVRIINGMPEHVHLLFLLNPQKALTDILKQVKGNTSHWINEQGLIKEKFAWQGGYAAYSVSESQLEKVYNYILNQKQHHKKKTFTEEYEEFIRLHGFNPEP